MNSFHAASWCCEVLLTVLINIRASLHSPLIKEDDTKREIDDGGVTQASVTTYNPDIETTDRTLFGSTEIDSSPFLHGLPGIITSFQRTVRSLLRAYCRRECCYLRRCLTVGLPRDLQIPSYQCRS